ncbi:MAG: hypothetical protein H6736_00325 [Alphaproteobacteria bacterium]|nr:hypothetical protein [Alphaproteobacteria bacterium]
MLAVLDTHQVRFVVVGGFAAWVHGAPIVTADLDIIFDPAPDNVRRLVAALAELGAVYRDPMGRRIAPTEEGLASTVGGGHHLFETERGELDVLRASSGHDYATLAPSAVSIEIGGHRVQLAALSKIIEMKAGAGRPKDELALPILRAVLEDEGQ